MSVLYYWRPDNYARDRAFGFGYHLNQGSPALALLPHGESVWAFTRRKRDGLYVLAAQLIARAVTRNVPNYRYGRFRVWADLDRSRYFDIDAPQAANLEPVVRALSIRASGTVLGQAFQGHAAVRTLTPGDHRTLTMLSAGLPALERVAFYPEDAFEARLIYGESLGMSRVVDHARRVAEQRMDYLYASTDPARSRRHVLHLQDLYDGRCQICLYDPLRRYGKHTCHAHHIQWLSRGGEDELDNLVLICPNHHAAVHRADAAFDYADLTFEFQAPDRSWLEAVQLNHHLPKAG